jgi:hypothetical protein
MRRRFFPSFLAVLASLAGAYGAVAQTAPSQPDRPTVFCWSGSTNQPGITPMTWIASDVQTPDKAAQIAIAQFNKRPVGERALFLWHVGNVPPLHDVRRLYEIVRDGPNTAPHVKWSQAVYQRLKQANLPPDRIVIDYESGMSTYQFGRPNVPMSRILMPVFNDPRAAKNLSPAVLKFTPADFDGGPRRAAAWDAWNAWNTHAVDTAIKTIAYDPATTVFQKPIPTTNYGNVLPSFPIYNLHGGIMDESVTGWESSPPLYLMTDGRRYEGRAKSAVWNRFIDNLNYARSTIVRGPLVPWLTYPSYSSDDEPWGGNKWLWAEQVKHLNQMGVRTYLLWNPLPYAKTVTDPSLAEDQYTSKVFTSLKLPPPVATPPAYPEIALDADQVTTGNVTTTYVDFLAKLKATSAATGPVAGPSTAGAQTQIYAPAGSGATATTGTSAPNGLRIVRKKK